MARAARASGRRPGSGLSLFLGFAFGGEELAAASSSNGSKETLTAGKGVMVGIGGMVTPWWPSEHLGLGVALDGALKYDSISASNGEASITRFPLALTAHLLTNGSGGNSYFMAKAGIIRDFGVNLSISGLGEADLQGHFGGTGALGYYGRSSDSFAWDFMGFFALTRHTIGTETVDANSFGVTMGVHLNL